MERLEGRGELGCRARGGCGGGVRCALLRGGLRALQVLPSPPLGERAPKLFAQAPLSGRGSRTLFLRPPLWDQSDPCLALRESRFSLPPSTLMAIFINCCTEMLSEDSGRRLQIWCLLAPLPEAVPSSKGAAARSGRGMKTELWKPGFTCPTSPPAARCGRGSRGPSDRTLSS